MSDLEPIFEAIGLVVCVTGILFLIGVAYWAIEDNRHKGRR